MSNEKDNEQSKNQKSDDLYECDKEYRRRKNIADEIRRVRKERRKNPQKNKQNPSKKKSSMDDKSD